MDYYQCTIEDLHAEIRRRGMATLGSGDQLSEALKRDDDARGSDASTVNTEGIGLYVPRELNLSRTAEFGPSVSANLLVNEKIIYWTLNSFFSTLQLFFESGLSCTIEGGQLLDATVGLDSHLRFRLTDCTHEEAGRITKSMRPDKFVRFGNGIAIKEAVIARRKSIAVVFPGFEETVRSLSPCSPSAIIKHEQHIVVGLRLEGMKQMGYIWAKVCNPRKFASSTWSNVRIAGLRRDVPCPSLFFPMHEVKPGGEVVLTSQQSVISKDVWGEGNAKCSRR